VEALTDTKSAGNATTKYRHNSGGNFMRSDCKSDILRDDTPTIQRMVCPLPAIIGEGRTSFGLPYLCIVLGWADVDNARTIRNSKPNSVSDYMGNCGSQTQQLSTRWDQLDTRFPNGH
jgi:hypothetical protein